MKAMTVQDLIARLLEFDRQDEVFIAIRHPREDKHFYKATAVRIGLDAGKHMAEIIVQ